MWLYNLIEQELLEQDQQTCYMRELYLSNKWPKLFEPKSLDKFEAMIQNAQVPDDPYGKQVFKCVDERVMEESSLFRRDFDVFLRGAMRYNIGWIHSHDFFEMYYLHRGSCTQIINGNAIEMRPGDFLILAPDSSHFTQILDDTSIAMVVALRKSTFQSTFFSLFLGADILSEFIRNVLYGNTAEPYLIFRTGGDISIRNQLYNMYYEFEHPVAYSRHAINNNMSNLFIYLLRNYQDRLISSSNDVQTAGEILSMLQYIQCNYKTVSLTELRGKYHFQQQYISKIIKRETGKTFTELKQALRLQNAAELLQETKLSISDIAAELNYSDQSHFTRYFKAEYGVTPNQYRQQHQARE